MPETEKNSQIRPLPSTSVADGERGRGARPSETPCAHWRLGLGGGRAWRLSNGAAAATAAALRGNKGEVGAGNGVEWSRASGARLRRARALRGPPECHPYAVAGDRPPRGGRGLTRSGVGAGARGRGRRVRGRHGARPSWHARVGRKGGAGPVKRKQLFFFLFFKSKLTKQLQISNLN
jgi:hypothetical protein